jgi:hypothetical protein
MTSRGLFYIFLAALAVLPACVHAQEVYGSPGDPLVAEVLGTEVHTRDPEEMRYLILRKLVDRYALAHGIEVTRADVDAYIESMNRMAENERRQNETRRMELIRKLASPGLNETERQQLTDELDSLDELMENLLQGSSLDEDPEAYRKAREKAASAFIRQWKINRALYRQYGGRIIFQQGGPEPLDGYRRFLEEQQKRGDFEILDKSFDKKFWDYYRNDDIHSFYPAGSEEEAKAFATPWWLAEVPENGQ